MIIELRSLCGTTPRTGLTIKQNKHVLRASREGGGGGEDFFLWLIIVYILNNIYIYMGAQKSFKCLGPLWILIRPCVAPNNRK